MPLDEAAWQQPEALRTACAEAGQQIVQLQQNLAEERAMAADIEAGLPGVVRKYISLSASDQRADI